MRITKKLPDNWYDLFKNHCELPPEEFQFIIGKQWKTPTDSSEGYCKVNNNLPSDHTEGENSRSIETNISPQMEQVGYINSKKQQLRL